MRVAQELPSNLSLRILGNEKVLRESPKILGSDAEYPVGHPKDKF